MRGLPALVELLGGAVAAVGVALGQQPLGVLAVDVEPLGLPVRPVRAADVGALVPVEAEPPQVLEHARDGLLGHAARVGVLDAQHERAAVVAREQPREQRAAHVADVHRAARAPARTGSGRVTSRTGFASVPTPSTSTSTTSPAASLPTPSGVPVSRTSPGSSVMNAVMYSISVATPKTMSESCAPAGGSRRSAGSRTSTSFGSRSVSIHGPSGRGTVEALRPRPLVVGLLQVAERHVVAAGVAEDDPVRVLGPDVLARAGRSRPRAHPRSRRAG